MSGLANRQSATPQWRPQGQCPDWTRQVCKTRAPDREPRKKQDSKSFALACAFLRPLVWLSVSCVSCFPFSGVGLCPCLPFCVGCCGFYCACLSSPLFHGRRPENRALRQVYPIGRVHERYVSLLGLYWVQFISLPFQYSSIEPVGLEGTSHRTTSDPHGQRSSRREFRSSRIFQNSERLNP